MLLPIQLDDVCSLRQPTRSLLEAGRVFAVHQVKGQWQCASITLSGCSVYLHALQDQTLPAGAATLQVRYRLFHMHPPTFHGWVVREGGSPLFITHVRESGIGQPRCKMMGGVFLLTCTANIKIRFFFPYFFA